jgi:endoglucanase
MMKNRHVVLGCWKIICGFSLFVCFTGGLTETIFAQAAVPSFKTEDYRRAQWMATRFYGGQRSGKGVNWLLAGYSYSQGYVKDADGTYDLTGGWHDCGDFPMFGQTQFYSAYVLLRGYLTFPTGYDDLYDGLKYSDYVAKGAWDFDDGKPNGIPDILEEIKYATDFFIKAARDSETFYFQKGTGGSGPGGEHGEWVTSGYYSQQLVSEAGGEKDISRPVYKNPEDGSMPSFCAATLAGMSRAYRRFDPTYADLCLKHARYAFTYAQKYQGKTVGSTGGTFYGRNNHSQDDYAIAASELYKATGEAFFKEQAQLPTVTSNIKWHNWGFDYSNNDDLAFANLGQYLDDTTAMEKLNGNGQFLKAYSTNITDEGLTKQGGDWGRMRYPANAAFIAALYGKGRNSDLYDKFLFRQIDFILGNNSAKQSFLTGFCKGCTNSPLHPHHRNVYLAERPQGEVEIPTKNEQHGSLIGGNLNPSETNAKDLRANYQIMEVCIDYQAGLVGALGYMMSKLAPVDTNRFSGLALNPRRQPGLGGQHASSLENGKWLFENQDHSQFMDAMGRKARVNMLRRAMNPN